MIDNVEHENLIVYILIIYIFLSWWVLVNVRTFSNLSKK